jgi:hypothetical protein
MIARARRRIGSSRPLYGRLSACARSPAPRPGPRVTNAPQETRADAGRACGSRKGRRRGRAKEERDEVPRRARLAWRRGGAGARADLPRPGGRPRGTQRRTGSSWRARARVREEKCRVEEKVPRRGMRTPVRVDDPRQRATGPHRARGHQHAPVTPALCARQADGRRGGSVRAETATQGARQGGGEGRG